MPMRGVAVVVCESDAAGEEVGVGGFEVERRIGMGIGEEAVVQLECAGDGVGGAGAGVGETEMSFEAPGEGEELVEWL